MKKSTSKGFSNMNKPIKIYKTCLLVGRFQPFHVGHLKMIRKALCLAETVLVFIGSSQESRTERNPFSYEERKEMISKCFRKNKNLIIKPLRDIKVGDNSIWGEFVLEEAFNVLGEYPSLYLSGQEKVRASWFYGLKQAKTMDEISVHKTDNISASILREKLVKCFNEVEMVYSDNYSYCLEKIPKECHKDIPFYAKTLKTVKENS